MTYIPLFIPLFVFSLVILAFLTYLNRKNKQACLFFLVLNFISIFEILILAEEWIKADLLTVNLISNAGYFLMLFTSYFLFFKLGSKKLNLRFPKFNLLYILIPFIILRLTIAFYFDSGIDIGTNTEIVIENLFSGKGVYIGETYYYPPTLIFYTLPFVILFGNFHHIGIKTAAIFSDLINIFLLYLIGKKLVDENAGIFSSFLYAFNPVLIYESSFNGVNDGIVMSFMLVSFYFLLVRKTKLSAFFFTLAFTSKWFPLLVLPFILKELRNRKDIMKFLSTFLAASLLILLPFFNKNFVDQTIVYHFNREMFGFESNLTIYKPLSFIISNRTLILIIQLTMLTIYFIKCFPRDNLIRGSQRIFLLTILFSGRIHRNYYFWFLPFSFLLVFYPKFYNFLTKTGKLRKG